MTDILTRAGCFLAIILMGYLLRQIGFFAKEDFHVLSKIVIKITLTAAIVTNFAGRELEYSMLLLTLMGFFFGILMMVAGYLVHTRQGREAQAFAVLNSAGCNIGNFVLPFAQNFLGAVGVMAVSLFDVGNSFICLGGAFGAASMVKASGEKVSFRPMFRAMSRSVPLMTYMVMVLLCALHIGLPQPVVQFASIIGNANAFMAMLMLGVGFNLSGNSSQTADILRIILTRYGIGLALALVSYFVLPFPLEYRQALVILFLSPIASAAPAFTADLKGDFGLSSAINSISILISIVLITASLVVML